MKRSLPPLAVLLACACLPFTKSVGEVNESEGTSSDDGSNDGSATGTTLPGDSETSLDPSSSSDSTTGSATTDATTGAPPSLDCPPQPGEAQCDPLVQDCPSGSHCVPWNESLDAFVCAPLVDDPAGRHEACTSDPARCSDDCEAGTYCFPETLTDPAGPGGLCLDMCSADGDDETCPAGDMCVTCATCDVGTCFPSCDPLAPQCPDGAPACIWLPPDGFVCMPAEHLGSPIGQACEFPNECAEGLVCADDSVFGPACSGPGCCTELCDLVDGDPACSDPAHVCIPFSVPGTEPEGSEHVGMCGVPEAHPCATPGVCPPPGIDDTYPWCSETTDAYCPDGVLFSYTGYTDYTGDIGCEGFCQCQTPCVNDLDCSQPPTGTATPECVEDPLGLGNPTSCMLSCDAGQTCPDGMTCIEWLSGEPLCIWISPLSPEEC